MKALPLRLLNASCPLVRRDLGRTTAATRIAAAAAAHLHVARRSFGFHNEFDVNNFRDPAKRRHRRMAERRGAVGGDGGGGGGDEFTESAAKRRASAREELLMQQAYATAVKRERIAAWLGVWATVVVVIAVGAVANIARQSPEIYMNQSPQYTVEAPPSEVPLHPELAGNLTSSPQQQQQPPPSTCL